MKYNVMVLPEEDEPLNSPKTHCVNHEPKKILKKIRKSAVPVLNQGRVGKKIYLLPEFFHQFPGVVNAFVVEFLLVGCKLLE